MPSATIRAGSDTHHAIVNEVVDAAVESGCPPETAPRFAARFVKALEERIGTPQVSRHGIGGWNRKRIVASYFYQRYRRSHLRAERDELVAQLTALVDAVQTGDTDGAHERCATATDVVRSIYGT